MDFVANQMIGPRWERDRRDRERLADAAFAKKRAKHKGRNHWRNWERRKMAAEVRKAAAIKVARRRAATERYHEQVRAFWEGLLQDHPSRSPTC